MAPRSSCSRRRRGEWLRRGSTYPALVTILHVHRAIRSLGAERRHAEFTGDGTRCLVGVVDAGDDAIELGGVERPIERKLAGLLRHAARLYLRAHRTHQLEIVRVGRAGLEQSREAQRHWPFNDGEQVIRQAGFWARECSDDPTDTTRGLPRSS